MDKIELNNQIEKTLESLDGIQRASPGPFFFTRLDVRMNRQGYQFGSQVRTFWDTIGSFLTKPVVALGGVLVIVAMNLTVIYSNNDTQPDQVEAQNDYVANDEYVQLTNNIYEIENIKP